MITGIIDITIELLNLISLVILIAFILDLLLHFDLVNRYNPTVVKVQDFLKRLTEPLYNFVRRYIKPYNGIDFSPLVILLAIRLITHILVRIEWSIMQQSATL